jgi:hypothetical protein
VGDVGEHKLGEVGNVHIVGEVLAEAGKGEAGEQVLGWVSTEGKCPLSQGDHHRQGVHCEQGIHGCQHSLYQCNTNIFNYSNIRILGGEYFVFKYEYLFSSLGRKYIITA